MRNFFIAVLLLSIVTGCGKSSSGGIKEGENPADSLVALAEQGDAEAEYYPMADEWICLSNELAEMGYVGEQYAYGTSYYHGWYGVGQDYEKAFECFMNVVESSDDINWVYADAEFYLGLCYYYGEGIEQDYKKAMEWWMKAAEYGDELAQEALRLTKEANGLFVDLKKKIDIERGMILREEI